MECAPIIFLFTVISWTLSDRFLSTLSIIFILSPKNPHLYGLEEKQENYIPLALYNFVYFIAEQINPYSFLPC